MRLRWLGRATAEELLQRGDPAALRLLASAWFVADARHADHLSGALSGRFFELSCGAAAGRDRFRSMLHELLADADPEVRNGAEQILAGLIKRCPVNGRRDFPD